MPLLIIGCILTIISLFIFFKSAQNKITLNNAQQKYKTTLLQDIKTLQNKNAQLERKQRQLIQEQLSQKEQFNNKMINWQNNRKKEIEAYLQSYQKNADKAVEEAALQIEQQKNLLYQNFATAQKEINKQKQTTQNELDKLKASLAAGVKARLRDLQKKDKLNFYKLSINDADLSDVNMLENLKSSFHKPVVLSKLIWTQYFQKQMTELCDRILGKKIICGIYKITDLITEECYIGQSVNIAQRFKEHCKCGLGIDASTTNKLYNTMQRDKVWNFTFELLEECPRQLLNEKERFWIQMYQSDKFGMNTTKGNKT